MKSFTLDEWSDILNGHTGNVFMDQLGADFLIASVAAGDPVIVSGPEDGMIWNASLEDGRLKLVQDWNVLGVTGYQRPSS